MRLERTREKKGRKGEVLKGKAQGKERKRWIFSLESLIFREEEGDLALKRF